MSPALLASNKERTNHSTIHVNFDVLLTVHLSIFISVINQLDAQNFVLQYVYVMLTASVV